MRTRGWTITMTLLALTTAPVAGQDAHAHGSQKADGEGGMMGQGMMQMCHAMMGSMEGGMMGSMEGGMMGSMEGGMMSSMEGGMMGSMEGGMMSMMQPGPAAILGAAEQLSLSDDQVARLEELRSSKDNSHMKAAMAAHRSAAKALAEPTPDLDAYEAAMREAAGQMAEAHIAMTRVSLATMDLLTEEQRAKLSEIEQHGMMGSGGEAAGNHEEHHR